MGKGKHVSEFFLNISCASGVVSDVIRSSRTISKDRFITG